MTRICITSDLHLGITSERAIGEIASAIRDAAPDLTVLAGDQGEPLGNFTRCLDLFAGLPGAVAVLAGNHDLWAGGGQSSRDLWEHALPQTTRERGMLWLEEATWRQDGLACAGSIAWYDYSAADPAFLASSPAFFAKQKHAFNNDAKFLDWGWSDPEFAARVGDGLMGRLTALEDDAEISQVLVVTHVPLCDEQLMRKSGDARWGVSNAYFGNLTLGQRVLRVRKVRAIISGHTHVKREGIISRASGGEVFVSVLGADYRAPAFEVLDTDSHPSFQP